LTRPVGRHPRAFGRVERFRRGSTQRKLPGAVRRAQVEAQAGDAYWPRREARRVSSKPCAHSCATLARRDEADSRERGGSETHSTRLLRRSGPLPTPRRPRIGGALRPRLASSASERRDRFTPRAAAPICTSDFSRASTTRATLIVHAGALPARSGASANRRLHPNHDSEGARHVTRRAFDKTTSTALPMRTAIDTTTRSSVRASTLSGRAGAAIEPRSRPRGAVRMDFGAPVA